MQTLRKMTGQINYYATNRLIGLLAAVMLLISCQPKDGRQKLEERELMHNSFEELGGWHGERPATIVTEKAHTGHYAVRVNIAEPYSPTYRVPLGTLVKHRPRRLTISAWVWVPRSADDAMIVVAITPPNDREHPVFTKNVYLANSSPIHFQKWKKVSRSIDLPADIHADSELVVYLWLGYAKQPVYMDDITLTELW